MWKVVDTFKQLHLAFARNNLHSFCLKPKQVQCFEYMLRGFDVITVLPTGFGKSLLFQLLPDFLPVKSCQNIVLVVSPLSSIIEDQISALNTIGISADVLPMVNSPLNYKAESFFDHTGDENEEADETCKVSKELIEGKVKLVFGHPESLLSTCGRKLLKSEVYQKNVVACVIDEAHCVEVW